MDRDERTESASQPSGAESQSGAPWWNEPHGGPGQWSGHGTPGHPGPSWPNATPGEPAPDATPGQPAPDAMPGQPAAAAGAYGPGPGGQTPGAGSYGPGPQGPGTQGPGPQGAGGHGAPPSGPGYGGAWAGDSGWGWGHPGGWGGPPGGGYRSREPRRGTAAAAAGVVAAAAVLIGVGIGYGIWNGGTTPSASSTHLYVPHKQTNATTTSTSSGKLSQASGAPANTAAIAKKVRTDLVDINTVLGYETEEAAGTGMVLTSTGKVLTNNHVIEQSTSISVTDLGNGKTYSASVLGYSHTDDVALIQLKTASGLKTVTLGNSSSVKVGQAVVGIGNAGGVGGTPSVAGGSVSALNQAITASDEGSLGTTTEHLTGLIESDCDIQPGDSGGPLVDTAGDVVGMDTAASEAQGYSISGASTGQGYSIPINTAISVVHQIEAKKASTSVHIGGTAFLGVFVTSASASTHSGVPGIGRTLTATPAATTPATTSSTAGSGGAFVEVVIAGTPAKSAGITAGDVITSIAGHTVTSVNDVATIVESLQPGQTVQIKWTTPSANGLRGSTQTANVTMASGPPD